MTDRYTVEPIPGLDWVYGVWDTKENKPVGGATSDKEAAEQKAAELNNGAPGPGYVDQDHEDDPATVFNRRVQEIREAAESYDKAAQRYMKMKRDDDQA
jgi:hypothetical protein